MLKQMGIHEENKEIWNLKYSPSQRLYIKLNPDGLKSMKEESLYNLKIDKSARLRHKKHRI